MAARLRMMAIALALAGAGMAAPPADALTRKQADRAALALLEPAKKKSRTGVVVYGMARPLAKGADVFELTPSQRKRSPARRRASRVAVAPLDARAWIYWMDTKWGARFAHMTTLLLIDDETGRQVRREHLDYWPVINGSSPFMGKWRFDRRHQVFSSVPGDGSVRAPRAAARLVAGDVKVEPGSLAGDCIITIGLRKDPDFKADFPGIEGLGTALGQAGAGIKTFVAQATRGDPKTDAPDGYDLMGNIGYIVDNEGCKDILIYMDGHGTPAEDGPAQVLTGTKWIPANTKNAAGEDLYLQRNAHVTAGDIKTILNRFKTTTFKLKIDACFSGRFKDEIPRAKFPNVHILEASSASDEVSWSYLPAVQKEDGTVVPNNTNNPGNRLVDDPARPGQKKHAPGRGEFTNGNLAALTQFFTSPDLVARAKAQGGPLLVTALTYAAYTEKGHDFAAQQNLTHPTFYSDQGPLAQLPRGEVKTLGSTLQAPADTPLFNPEDTDFWIELFGGAAHTRALGPGATMPADGQILTVRVKGTALASTDPGAPPPLTEIHFSALRPQPDGSMRVIITSQAFNLPVGGDPNQTTTFAPENFCVLAGDVLTLSTEGGFDPTYYPQGVKFQVFGRVPGSQIGTYSKHNGVMNGAQFTGSPVADTELLMQWDLGTGDHATKLCPGGTQA